MIHMDSLYADRFLEKREQKKRTLRLGVSAEGPEAGAGGMKGDKRYIYE
jgi:hypothetical protein